MHFDFEILPHIRMYKFEIFILILTNTDVLILAITDVQTNVIFWNNFREDTFDLCVSSTGWPSMITRVSYLLLWQRRCIYMYIYIYIGIFVEFLG